MMEVWCHMANDEILSRDEADVLLYLADEMNPLQKQAFEARLASDASLRAQLAELDVLDARLRNTPAQSASLAFVSERALKSSLKVVREQAMRRGYLDYATQGSRFRLPPYAVAAGIAILFTLGFIGWLYTTPPISVTPSVISQNNPRFGPGPGQGSGQGFGLTTGFGPVGMDVYGESSMQIDHELDALSMLSDFENTDAAEGAN